MTKTKKIIVTVILISTFVVALSAYIKSSNDNNLIVEAKYFQKHLKQTQLSKIVCTQVCSFGQIIQKQTKCCNQLSVCQQKSKCLTKKLIQYQNNIDSLQKQIDTLKITCQIFSIIHIVVLIFIFIYLQKKRSQNIRALRQRRSRLLLSSLVEALQHSARVNRQRQEEHQSIKQSLLSREFFLQNVQQNCPICMTNLSQDRVVALNCTHIFHTDCVIEWLQKKGDCPLCRTKFQF